MVAKLIGVINIKKIENTFFEASSKKDILLKVQHLKIDLVTKYERYFCSGVEGVNEIQEEVGLVWSCV